MELYCILEAAKKKTEMKQLCCELNTSYRAAEMERKDSRDQNILFSLKRNFCCFILVSSLLHRISIYLTSKFFIGPKSPKYSDSIKTKL